MEPKEIFQPISDKRIYAKIQRFYDILVENKEKNINLEMSFELQMDALIHEYEEIFKDIIYVE